LTASDCRESLDSLLFAQKIYHDTALIWYNLGSKKHRKRGVQLVTYLPT
jgi:hypothetical protein